MKTSNNIKVLTLSAYTSPVVTESKKSEWVEYGEDNNYFQFLIDRYTKSTTNNAIINNISRLVYGKGLTALDATRKPNEYANMITLFAKEDVRKMVMELKMLGQCAIQVHYSKDRKTVLKAYHMSVPLLRAEKCNKEGDITGYYYSDNWEDVKNFEPVRYDAFGYGSGEIEILYIQPYSVGMKYYSHVDYQGGLPYTMLEEEVADYLINEVKNGFSGTKIVNFNNGRPTDEEQDAISAKVMSKLTGSRGQKVIIAFNDNAESKTTVDDIPLNDAPEHYSYLSTEAMQKIMLSHNVTSPLLFGIATSTGFSANADELKNSLIIFDNLVIRPMQELLLDAFDKILAVNEISLNLQFKPLQPLTSEGELTTEETNMTKMSSQDDFSDIIDLGEDESEEWELVDERDVDYELESELDNQIESLNNPKQSNLSKFVNFVSTGRATPKSPSAQDKEVKGVLFKVRYKYAGNPNPERPFCKAMMSAGKVYRKEDLINMDSNKVNKGFGHKGQRYDLFRFKGGPRCHHSFKRLTFRRIGGSDETIGTGSASVKGYKVTNPYEVSVQPNNLPRKGYHPDNNNLPTDAR